MVLHAAVEGGECLLALLLLLQDGRRDLALAGVVRGLNQNNPKVMAAYNACKSQIPASILQQQQQRQQALTAFDSCMKDHGVTIPTGPPAAGTTRTTIDQSSVAYQTCKVLLPNGGAFGPGGSTSTTAP